MVGWGFLTSHARVLLCIARDPGARLRDIGSSLGITERSAHGFVADLAAAGYVARACPHQRPGPAGPDVLPDGRDCGSSDYLAPGGSRLYPQLGLSLLLGARRLSDDGRAVGGGPPG